MKRLAWGLAAAALLTAPASVGLADETDTQVRARLASYIEAFNSGEPTATASYWAEDAVSIDQETGDRCEGRDAILADLRALFAENPGLQLSGRVDRVRSVAAGVAIAEGVATLAYPTGEQSESSFAATLVKENEQWVLDTVLESEAPSPVTSGEALAQLDWLLGNWRDDTEGVEVNTSVRRSPNDAFLIRSFRVDFLDGEGFEGTQIIGWDPYTKQLRAWTFNSDGSFGDGYVLRSGDAWLFRTSSVSASGTLSSSTQVISIVDADTLRVEKIGQSVNGLPAPASEPITVVRVDASQPPAQQPEATQ